MLWVKGPSNDAMLRSIQTTNCVQGPVGYTCRCSVEQARGTRNVTNSATCKALTLTSCSSPTTLVSSWIYTEARELYDIHCKVWEWAWLDFQARLWPLLVLRLGVSFLSNLTPAKLHHRSSVTIRSAIQVAAYVSWVWGCGEIPKRIWGAESAQHSSYSYLQ